MKFQRKKRPLPEISVTSMVDVVLLLLFFFMVSSTFNQKSSIKIKLPQANGMAISAEDTTLTLVIDGDGDYFLDGSDGQLDEVINKSVDTLQRALAKHCEHPEQTPLIIQADSKAPHQAVMTALEAASEVGFSHITFAAEQPQGKP